MAGKLGDFLPLDDTSVRFPASSIAPSEAVANMQAEGLDPNYTGMPATTQQSSWIIYALIALAIYFLWGED